MSAIFTQSRLPGERVGVHQRRIFVLAHLQKYQPGKVVVLSEYVSPASAKRYANPGAVAAFTKSKTADCVRHVLSLAPDYKG